MTTLRRSWPLVAAAACVLVAAGCTDDAPTPDPKTAWPTTSAPVATDGLVWAAGSDVHLADGSVVELDQPAGSYVVAGPGVFYVNADPDGAPFLLATPDGEVVETNVDPYVPSVQTSLDGHWLAFLDQPEGENGPREAVVIDTTTGAEVVRSSEGLVPGDTTDVDWADLYEDSPVDMAGVVDDTAYVPGLDETLAYDLPTGESAVVDEPVRRVDDPPYANPSGTWQVPVQDFGAVPVLDPASGTSGASVTTYFEEDPSAPPPLPGDPDLGAWTLFGWLDDRTAVGLTSTTDPRPVPVIVTCAVASGACEVLEGTEEGVSLPIDRPRGLPPVYPSD